MQKQGRRWEQEHASLGHLARFATVSSRSTSHLLHWRHSHHLYHMPHLHQLEDFFCTTCTETCTAWTTCTARAHTRRPHQLPSSGKGTLESPRQLPKNCVHARGAGTMEQNRKMNITKTPPRRRFRAPWLTRGDHGERSSFSRCWCSSRSSLPERHPQQGL